MALPDTGSLELWALSLAVVASALALASIFLGLYSTITGRDHWPALLRWMRRRIPASDEDQRMHGMALVLNGAAMLLVLMAVTTTVLAGRSRVGEPVNTLQFALMVLAIAGSVACTIGAYVLGLRVRFEVVGSPSGEHIRS